MSTREYPGGLLRGLEPRLHRSCTLPSDVCAWTMIIPCHICTATGLSPYHIRTIRNAKARACEPLPHLPRDRAHPAAPVAHLH